MSRRGLVICLMLLTGTSLAGCSRTDSDDVPVGDPLAATAERSEDRFGKGFGKAFRADPNSEPRIVSDNDMAPVSMTAEPILFD